MSKGGKTLVLALCLSAMTCASAQSTDGFHAVQVLPIVVDSASFVTRITFESPNLVSPTVVVKYFPAEGTSQATPITCSNGTHTYNEGVTLRELCPSLAAGSQFGFLYLTGSFQQRFAVHARVENVKGIGFSVEGYPVSDFTSAGTMVAGLRRMAATASSPAYQSNCFIANLNQLNPAPAPVTTTVTYSYGANTASVALKPGKLIRILSVLDALGVSAADIPNATIRFEEVGEGEPGLMTFCTVQDNTSFGADFRIGKQTHGNSTGSLADSIAQDDGALRDSWVGQDVRLPTGPGSSAAREFAIPPGKSSNAHIFYFRHPDWISCGLSIPGQGDPSQTNAITIDYGLELRLVASDGITVLAGGNDTWSFDALYLGDKGVRDEGANTRYVLEVESNGRNEGVARPYLLHCASGSGHGLGELVRTNGPVLF